VGKKTVRFVMSVSCPYGKTPVPMDEFSRNVSIVSKICRLNSSFIEIWQE